MNSDLSEGHRTDLELLASHRFNLALLVDNELVGHGLVGVCLGPDKRVAILNHLRDDLEVTALLDDIIGNAWDWGGVERGAVLSLGCPRVVGGSLVQKHMLIPQYALKPNPMLYADAHTAI